jgi:diaminopimelate epimerase
MARFHKYEGLGNDFVLFDLLLGEPSPSPLPREVACRLCDRHRGIGADGLLALLPPSDRTNDARLRIINADGSEAEMCGNGVRCAAKYLYEMGGVQRESLRIETLAGPRACSLTFGEHGEVSSVAVEMGAPILEAARVPVRGVSAARFIEAPLEVAGKTLRLTALSMGNPHAVTFVDEKPLPLAEKLGPALEIHPSFPQRTNAEFARVEDDGSLDLVVWERGCGITLACGTGACAAAVAAALTGRILYGRETEVHLPGGTLWIKVAPELAGVTMRGPARHVFSGDVEL